jgi:hypothetical protein
VNLAEALKICVRRGHHWANEETYDITEADCEKLTDQDYESQVIIATAQSFFSDDYIQAKADRIKLNVEDIQPPNIDGHCGVYTQAMLDIRRCAFPDFLPPKDAHFQFEDPRLQEVMCRLQETGIEAVGSGNWPRCHGVGNYHSASVRIDMTGIASFLTPIFKDVLSDVRIAYAKVGCLFRFVDSNGKDMVTGEQFNGPININFSFVQRSDGWIGLAILGNNQGCSSRIWCRYLATYRPSNVRREWVTLIKHELGHNCGSGHLRGGTMNPSIVTGLPSTTWGSSDPFLPWLNQRFGGQPVPIDDNPPPTSLEERVARLETAERVHWQQMTENTRRIKELENR